MHETIKKKQMICRFMTFKLNPAGCKLCQWDSKDKIPEMFPRGIKDVFRCGILSASHQLCFAKTFALPRSQLWFPVMLPDIHMLDKPREHDRKIKSRDATLDWILSWTPSVSTSKPRQQQWRGVNQAAPQCLYLFPFCTSSMESQLCLL